MRGALLVLVLAALVPAATAAPQGAVRCSATGMPTKAAVQKLPVVVAKTRARVVAAAVACDYARLERIAKEQDGFTWTYGPARSAAAYWRAEERRGGRPLAKLVAILGMRAHKNEVGAWSWPPAYTEHPTRAQWEQLIKAKVLTRAEADSQRTHGNMYFGYRTAITRTGDWLFFVQGD